MNSLRYALISCFSWWLKKAVNFVCIWISLNDLQLAIVVLLWSENETTVRIQIYTMNGIMVENYWKMVVHTHTKKNCTIISLYAAVYSVLYQLFTLIRSAKINENGKKLKEKLGYFVVFFSVARQLFRGMWLLKWKEFFVKYYPLILFFENKGF